MKKVDIKLGGTYLARVSGRLVTVRVDAIREHDGYRTQYGRLRAETHFHVVNMATGRNLVFRSAQKFRKPVAAPRTADDLSPAERERLAKEDLATRTPDAELSQSEREDVPERVEHGHVMEQWEEQQRAREETETAVAEQAVTEPTILDDVDGDLAEQEGIAASLEAAYDERRALECLSDGPRHLDDISAHIGDETRAARALVGLELKKQARRLPGNRYERYTPESVTDTLHPDGI